MKFQQKYFLLQNTQVLTTEQVISADKQKILRCPVSDVIALANDKKYGGVRYKILLLWQMIKVQQCCTLDHQNSVGHKRM